MPKREPKTFMKGGVRHRIVRRSRPDPDAAFGRAHYNVLQCLDVLFFGLVKRWGTIEEERIPDHVIISVGCFGDTGGWSSRLPREGFA